MTWIRVNLGNLATVAAVLAVFIFFLFLDDWRAGRLAKELSACREQRDVLVGQNREVNAALQECRALWAKYEEPYYGVE
jgi:hypothetical protein